ncbi:ATP-grasp domain-containing protein [Streptomyces sp. NBC_01298]|uniref:ATP-binding protein n=1 Tax=Streptomyces sp. NBC_01298 TaxID=2903817 RepID=UPI002E1408E1|nr:ATP-grasp domain-containing protein [Streptomyces sp. NBC_01298]
MRSEQVRLAAVMVDAYTRGNHLPPAFARLGVYVVHVQSTTELMTSMRPPDLTAYRAVVPHGTPAETAARLAEFEPICVVAGQEPGVELADELSELLGLPGNGTALSRARRDKYEMIETLRRAGVRCADQLKSGSAEEIVAWAEQRGAYPVVVKPLSSAATEGVAVCRGPVEIRKAAEAVLGTVNIFGERNDEVLVQPFLDGEEYMVDFVSYGGGGGGGGGGGATPAGSGSTASASTAPTGSTTATPSPSRTPRPRPRPRPRSSPTCTRCSTLWASSTGPRTPRSSSPRRDRPSSRSGPASPAGSCRTSTTSAWAAIRPT